MRVNFARTGLAAALALATAATGACTPLRNHQGYVIDPDLVNSVQPGVDNRQSVLQTLGKPTFASQFNQGEWYYVARDTRNFSYNKPKVKQATTIRISFDANGTVKGIDRTGAEQIASISPYGKTTPTLGKKRSLFAELFGNIGTVGAAGVGGGGGGGNGDNHDTP